MEVEYPLNLISTRNVVTENGLTSVRASRKLVVLTLDVGYISVYRLRSKLSVWRLYDCRTYIFLKEFSSRNTNTSQKLALTVGLGIEPQVLLITLVYVRQQHLPPAVAVPVLVLNLLLDVCKVLDGDVALQIL